MRFVTEDTEALPGVQVVGYGDRDARLVRNERRIGHHVLPEGRNEHDPRIFDTAAARAHFVRFVRFERDAEALDADGRAAFEAYACVPDTRVVTFGDEARKQMQRAGPVAHAARIEHAPRFVRSVRLRAHHDAEPRGRKRRNGRRRRHQAVPDASSVTRSASSRARSSRSTAG